MQKYAFLQTLKYGALQKHHILGEDVIFAETNNTSVDIC